MKYVLCLTQQCNLRCTYCYIAKAARRMSMDTAAKIVDFIYRRTPRGDDIDIGFFGGEPLLELDLMRAITERIEAHPDHDPARVELSVVSNGTIVLEPSVAVAPAAAAQPGLIPRIGYPGGIRAPHLHDEGQIYMLTRAQWREFADSMLATLRERMAEVNNIGFDQLMELSETVNSVT